LENSKQLILVKYEFGLPIIYCDTLDIKDHFKLPTIPIGLEKFYTFYKAGFTQGFSHSGNTLLIQNSFDLRKHNILKPWFDTLIQRYLTLSTIRIDKQILKFDKEKVIFRDSFNYKTDSVLNNLGSTLFYVEFSPDNSFVYLRKTRHYYGSSNKIRYEDTSTYQFHLNKLNDINKLPKQFGKSRQLNPLLKLMPDGKLYFIESYRDASFKYHTFVHCKTFPNQLGYSDFKMNLYPLKDIFGGNGQSFGFISNRWYDYVKPRPQIDYGCDAKVTLKNASYLSLKLDKFKWYFSRTQAGNFEDTVIALEPMLTYAKSGKYPYKVYGYSTAAVYGEWYEDTLYVNIPQKPVAQFLATDTIICIYLPSQFNKF